MASDIGQKIFDLEKHSADLLKNVSGVASAPERKIQESHGILYYNEKMPYKNYLKTCDAFENDACCSKIKELSKKCDWPARTY